MPPYSNKKQNDASTGSDKKQKSLYSFFSVSKAKPKANKSPSSTSTSPSSSTGSAVSGSGSSKANAKASTKATTPKTKPLNASAAAVASPMATASVAKIPTPITTNNTNASTSKSNTSNDNTKKQPAFNNLQASKVQLNAKLAVFWRDDRKYYACVVKKKEGHNFFLEYDDGENEWLDLRTEKFRFLEDDDDDGDGDADDSDEEMPDAPAAKNGTKKRPRIHDSDDEEFEFDMDDGKDDDDDDDEAFDDDEEAAAMDEEEDDFIVSDDDEEQPKKKKRAKAASKKAIQVTQHKTASSGSSSSSSPPITPKLTPKTSRPKSTSDASATLMTPTALTSFSAFSQPSATSTSSAALTNAPRRVTPPSSGRGASATSIALDKAEVGGDGIKALPYTRDVVNPAGSHMHNHLKFLMNPKDAKGRSKGTPGYDPRTLKVSEMELQQHNKNSKKWSPGVEQWWGTKAMYFDTVLLFKTGKFYEMFQMDADIGVEVLGFQYMKGHVAHAGFPEISYGRFADKLVRSGYKVARVEQTETPDMLKERKKKMKGKNLPKVVNREVCSIMSLGTRTFCYLDNEDMAEDGKGGVATGPLLVIREVGRTSDGDEAGDNADSMLPVCEYGIVVVDAARAIVTMGQFADDVLRTRMSTLIATFAPSEILVEGGENGASPTLRALLKSLQTTSASAFQVEEIQMDETFPQSTAVDATIRRKLHRNNGRVKPWDAEETLNELHKRGYFPKGSKKQQDSASVSRWPSVLRSVVEGNAELALSSFGAALFYLQRSLIDAEILTMGNIKAYIPPASPIASEGMLHEADFEDGAGDLEATPGPPQAGKTRAVPPTIAGVEVVNGEDKIKHMSIDGNTLVQLEILTNSIDHKPAGSLWSKINFTKTPHGERMLRAWLLRPLFRKAEIDRRADAVEELHCGDLAMAMDEAASMLGKCGDIERLLAKIHALSGTKLPGAEDDAILSHPSSRAVLYETKTYTKRKVGDFSKVLNGLRSANKIPELFAGLDIQSGLLKKIVTNCQDGGFFPDITNDLDWFFSVFDFEKAEKGEFEPGRGVDARFDEACDAKEEIEDQLIDFKNEMCSKHLAPLAKSTWKYTNTAPDSKDKYTIELPNSVKVPQDFRMIGKRGSGAKQINKYQAAAVEELVVVLERAIEVHKECKVLQMQNIFAKFDEKRTSWAAIASCTAVLDALGSLSKLANQPNYCRPKILECPLDASPCIKVIQGRHPCVEATPGNGEFIPNDLSLGSQEPGDQSQKVLLLSGPNMGGKSTLLRQTCLITILAQMGGFVPAAECELTPIDNIMTRLGASDRILLGQSTFFVELAETAAALRGSTRRSLILMDELGRGTSSFDGTAIASACLSYICTNLCCLSLFATHYHSLLAERQSDSNVRLAHMESTINQGDGGDGNITFLYTLGDGPVAASFGINVAKLARLPEEVLEKAKRVSSDFEMEINGEGAHSRVAPEQAVEQKQQLLAMIREGQGNLDSIEALWAKLQQ